MMDVPESPHPWRIRLRALRWPIVVLVLTIIVAAVSKNAGWFSVGGSVISGIGAMLWAGRLFRLKERSDDPPPPIVFDMLVNPPGSTEASRRQVDIIEGILGVWISIAGGIVASTVPFVFSLAHIWTSQN
jgi:hypothetical protein